MEFDLELTLATMKTPKFTFRGQIEQAKCVSVHDGDTAQFVFRIGGLLRRISCRMNGYNCAEVITGDPVEKKKACEATETLRGLILNKIVTLEFGDFDKYGRPLVVVTTDININEYMIASGLGVVYSGRGEKLW